VDGSEVPVVSVIYVLVRRVLEQLTEDYASRLVERAGIGAGDLVLDIGAGTGAVNNALVAAGARVIAVELVGCTNPIVLETSGFVSRDGALSGPERGR
jgi:predicted RNA methylase